MEKLIIIFDYASDIHITTLVICFVLCSKHYKGLEKNEKKLFGFLGSNVLFETSGRILPYYLGQNLILYNISSLIETIILYSYLKNTIKNNFLIFKSIFIIILAYNLREIFFTDYYDFKNYQNYSKPINLIFILSMFIYKIAKNLNSYHIKDISILELYFIFYLASSTVVFLPINILINTKNTKMYLLFMFNLINVTVLYLTITDVIINKKKHS
jgi:hypothetical protein